jgi:hypothetical protein
MAESKRHAAGHRYEVHEALEGAPTVDLGLRFETSDLGTAVDFAFDYLERRDPLREGAVSALEIVRVDGSERETVWTYGHSKATSSAGELVRLWGYDVTRVWSRPYGGPVRAAPARNY